jgi:NADP-dependent 3-hydroxy acid dehydrogenase YdfG
MSASYPFTSALITGASSGIGEAMVQLLGDAGIPQVIVARRVDRLDELAAGYTNVEVLAVTSRLPRVSRRC